MRLGDPGLGLGAGQGAGRDVSAVQKAKVLFVGFNGVNRGVDVGRHLGRNSDMSIKFYVQ